MSKILFLTHSVRSIVRSYSFLHAELEKDPRFIVRSTKSNQIASYLQDILAEIPDVGSILINSGLYFSRKNGKICRYIPGQESPFLPDLCEAGIPVVVLNQMDDVHGSGQQAWEDIQSDGVTILSNSLGHQFFDPTRAEATLREPWLREIPFFYRHPEVITDRYVLLPHAMHLSEFEFLPKAQRSWDACVAGIGYWYRRASHEALGRRGQFRVPPQRTNVDRILGYLGSRHPRYFAEPYFWKFRSQIARSRVGVTCDGTVGYAIRKFFEIPAFGAALIAQFFPNSEALGFRDRVNCFKVEDPEAVPDILSDILRCPDDWEALARSGQNLIRQHHLVAHRVEQVVAVCTGLAREPGARFRWIEGKLEIIEKTQTV